MCRNASSFKKALLLTPTSSAMFHGIVAYKAPAVESMSYFSVWDSDLSWRQRIFFNVRKDFLSNNPSWSSAGVMAGCGFPSTALSPPVARKCITAARSRFPTFIIEQDVMNSTTAFHFRPAGKQWQHPPGAGAFFQRFGEAGAGGGAPARDDVTLLRLRPSAAASSRLFVWIQRLIISECCNMELILFSSDEIEASVTVWRWLSTHSTSSLTVFVWVDQSTHHSHAALCITWNGSIKERGLDEDGARSIYSVTLTVSHSAKEQDLFHLLNVTFINRRPLSTQRAGGSSLPVCHFCDSARLGSHGAATAHPVASRCILSIH